MLMVYQLV